VAVPNSGAMMTVMDATRTIGRLAEQAGVNVETIRYYERRGLLRQPRKPAHGARHYDDEGLRTVLFIKQAQGLGFSLEEIQDLLSLRTSKSRAVCSRVCAKATAKIDQIDEKIRTLQRMRAVLVELTDVCPKEGPAERCSILRALDGGAP
jgi:MerR family mercuric resistance operon transcriptional regulator